MHSIATLLTISPGRLLFLRTRLLRRSDTRLPWFISLGSRDLGDSDSCNGCGTSASSVCEAGPVGAHPPDTRSDGELRRGRRAAPPARRAPAGVAGVNVG